MWLSLAGRCGSLLPGDVTLSCQEMWRSSREMWLSPPGDVALSCNPRLEVERPPLKSLRCNLDPHYGYSSDGEVKRSARDSSDDKLAEESSSCAQQVG
jgi:hypothetical protein